MNQSNERTYDADATLLRNVPQSISSGQRTIQSSMFIYTPLYIGQAAVYCSCGLATAIQLIKNVVLLVFIVVIIRFSIP